MTKEDAEVVLYSDREYPISKRPKEVNWLTTMKYLFTFRCTRRLFIAHYALNAAEYQAKQITQERMELADQVNAAQQKIQQFGLHLKVEPFIPQYFGFKQERIEFKDPVGTKTAPDKVIYTKDKFLLMKAEDHGVSWILKDRNNEKDPGTLVRIPTLYEGVVVLPCLGVDFDLSKFLNEDSVGEVIREVMNEKHKRGAKTKPFAFKSVLRAIINFFKKWF